MSDFTQNTLTENQIADIRLAAAQMTDSRRRAFMAEMSIKYCSGKPRLTEKIFGFARNAVATGLGEKRTGIKCLGLQSCCCGNKLWEEKHPEIAEYLYRIAETHCQQDPKPLIFSTSQSLVATMSLVLSLFFMSKWPSFLKMFLAPTI